ncbi:MAG: amidohydrolase [Betaproteobacteria bacterium]|nr:amidohydrolase [Betaproteobacteria bacterium]MDH3437990.1 amidohydrolase [Betaproteobacteria bacterium]
MAAAPSIDIHAHYFPESYIKLIADHGKHCGTTVVSDPSGARFIQVGLLLRTGPITKPFIDLDERLKEMDRQGCDVHVLSLTQPMVYWADDDLSMKLSVAFNDAASEAHRAHPDRLLGFAVLPMQNPRLALEELERAAKLPGIRGVYMATAVRDRELSDRSFFPVYERMADLGLPLFLHPMMLNNERLKQYYLINLCGNPFDTAIAASHLIFGGVMDAFPKLQVCLPHAGGALPILRGRLDRGFHIRGECKTIPRTPSEYLKRFTYDTISYSEELLEDLIRLVGVDRIMMGSDYCFDIAYEEPVKIVTGMKSLNEEQKAKILGGNARRLLRL